MEQFSGNYTGPDWSDGKKQSSVAFGESDPQSELDKLSRLHDSAYARYKDRAHLDAADQIYARDAKVLVGKFPWLAGNLVQYGNYTTRQGSQLVSDAARYGPLPGLIKFGMTNIYNANKMLHGTYLKQELKDVEDYYNTDPRKGQAAVTFNKPSKKMTPFEEAQNEARAEKVGSNAPFPPLVTPPVGNTPAAPLETKSPIGKVADYFKGLVTKKNAVVPETPEQRNQRLIQAQKEHFENYQNTYMRAQLVPTKRRKYKKKRYNVQKAIRVLPAHCIH